MKPFAVRLCAAALIPCSAFAQSSELGTPIEVNTDQLRARSGDSKGWRHDVIPSGGWYDTSSREKIRQAFTNDYVPTRNITLSWTGDVLLGVAGSTSAAHRSASLARINFFRAMAGVPARIVEDPSLAQKSQQGAFMLRSNGSLTHDAPPVWMNYTSAGAEALAKGNICIGPSADTGCVESFMDDWGGNNAPVGHRRWILYPNFERTGVGNVPDATAGTWSAMWVQSWSASRPATRDSYVAWPPRGYVPYQLAFARWSFSYPDADFTAATVSVTRNGAPLSTLVESRSAMPASTRIGDNTIVFLPEPRSTNVRSSPVKPSGDIVYRVSIAGVRVGASVLSFEYDVIVFDPQAPPGIEVEPSLHVVSSQSTTRKSFVSTFPKSETVPVSLAAASNVTWIQPTLSMDSQGNGTVTLAISSNTGAPRTGLVSMGDAEVEVRQAGAQSACTFASDLSSVQSDWRGQDRTFGLMVSGTQCGAWSAWSSASWVQIYPLTGTGSETPRLTVFPNFSSLPRTGEVHIAGRIVTISQSGASGTRDERFIGLMYYNMLGRLASPAEVTFHRVNTIGNGGAWTRVAMNFLNSLEFNQGARFVAGLYVGILGRDAEFDGWLFQRKALSSGIVQSSTLVSNFINADEFNLKNPNLSARDFVKLLYRQILLREAAESEVNFQVAALATGLTRTALAVNFLNSSEFRVGTGARLMAFLIYATILNRNSTQPEQILRIQQLTSGVPLEQIVNDLVSSAELTALLN
jgi:hypothetical protein